MNVRALKPGQDRAPGVDADITRVCEIWRECRSRFGAPGEEEDAYEPSPVIQQRRVDENEQLGRNDPCWCGSGKKFKKCHGI